MNTPDTGPTVHPDTADLAPADEHVVTVLVRYFASARAAAGVDSELVRLPASASVGDAVEHVRRRHTDRLPRVLDACGFLLDGVAVRDMTRSLPDGSELDILPPFAGG
ncbi:MoaD/ThiS family protein [Saccharomonospora saliphila]|uniref:MoaD/ThiS family protein n=1 Tax=Saccharomonospora saliphila TaxID=369829 RepID=UPI00037E9BA1|nr:MoaD/ThiS family protein [Saccharomonospora saliphila]